MLTNRHPAGTNDSTEREAEETARCIAGQPGLNHRLIGNDDQILTLHGDLSGYRMQDFLAESDLATYRAYLNGPDAP